MFHVIARSIESRLMIRTWAEARVLWDIVVRASPGLQVARVLGDPRFPALHDGRVSWPGKWYTD